MSQQTKDPYCCLLDKMKVASDALDQGALTAYRSLRYAVRQLSREDALALIDSQISDLEQRVSVCREDGNPEHCSVHPS